MVPVSHTINGKNCVSWCQLYEVYLRIYTSVYPMQRQMDAKELLSQCQKKKVLLNEKCKDSLAVSTLKNMSLDILCFLNWKIKSLAKPWLLLWCQKCLFHFHVKYPCFFSMSNIPVSFLYQNFLSFFYVKSPLLFYVSSPCLFYMSIILVSSPCHIFLSLYHITSSCFRVSPNLCIYFPCYIFLSLSLVKSPCLLFCF